MRLYCSMEVLSQKGVWCEDQKQMENVDGVKEVRSYECFIGFWSLFHGDDQ